MTPDTFNETVLPRIVAAWDEHCFCANIAFRKILSFNFRDYGIGPTMLIDSEILIHTIIRERFSQGSEPTSHQGEITQVYTCPQCNTTCTELYAEFSINMYRSTVTFTGDPSPAVGASYLVGFRGFDQDAMRTIHDFQQARTTDDFIRQLVGG